MTGDGFQLLGSGRLFATLKPDGKPELSRPTHGGSSASFAGKRPSVLQRRSRASISPNVITTQVLCSGPGNDFYGGQAWVLRRPPSGELPGGFLPSATQGTGGPGERPAIRLQISGGAKPAVLSGRPRWTGSWRRPRAGPVRPRSATAWQFTAPNRFGVLPSGDIQLHLRAGAPR